MSRIFYISDWPAWHRRNGAIERIHSLFEFLTKRVEIYLCYVGNPDLVPLLTSDSIFFKRTAVLVPRRGAAITKPDDVMGFVLRDFCRKMAPDFCIFGTFRVDYLHEYLPAGTTAILDSMNVFSRKFANMGAASSGGVQMTRADEIAMFSKYDRVLMIEESQIADFRDDLPREKFIYVPQPVALTRGVVALSARTIGYLAADVDVNVHDLVWFLQHCWPNLRSHGVELRIAGAISRSFASIGDPAITIVGEVDNTDSFFRDIDIFINPVQIEAGLKVKNLQALGHGVPLVTTTKGMQGVEAGANTAFLLGDDATSFSDAVMRLIGSIELRTAVSASAYQFMQERYSSEICYADLCAYLGGALR
jgi:glycosyltransferase involved in cell wall biosynthesis